MLENKLRACDIMLQAFFVILQSSKRSPLTPTRGNKRVLGEMIWIDGKL
jgi:hypothetical protein